MPALLVYLLFGLALAWRALPSYRGTVKCWLGLVFGCVALMWLPCLPAFFLGFTMKSQYIALGAAFAATAALAFAPIPKEKPWLTQSMLRQSPSHRDMVGLLLSVIATAFCGYLLYTHVLLPHDDGSLWVGQSTYGDLAMHLGFIEGLYRQGTFPPEYTIYPGQLLEYPFLVNAASASLRFFGLSLRMSVIAPSLAMLFCVFYGFWLLADKLIDRLAPTAAAWLLFTCNGGFGFLYFIKAYRFSDILTGFYTTPTNLVDMDVRWVNVICDMLIPQRTTMAGWCVVLAAIYLLITLLEKSAAGRYCRREAVILGVTAGAMPMIHTHSFLALGVLSAVWFFAFLPKANKAGHAKRLFLHYVLYGAVCFTLALPQLILWTFQAAGTGNLLWWNPGWVAENGWLSFWAMNCGIVFIVMCPMVFFLRGDRARLFVGGAAIFLLANFVAFQPNPYDNNKLLYIWYMLTDILVCAWLWELLSELRRPAIARKAIAGFLVTLGMVSGLLTMFREAVSEYQLLDPNQVAAAEFILDNTPADSLFLTGTYHTNPVSILAGRNILCGPGMYLYYHGIDYGKREDQVRRMYESGEDFETYAARYGVDYVYISWAESANYAVDRAYFEATYPIVFQQGQITIFQIS